MKIYRVGGAVRDALLALTVQDIDYVVIGSTPEQMVAQGYTPVGKDFPVFLHPNTHAEYALARTERKSAPGYRGFVFHCSPDITLEQDLQRRDLTINAMAIADDADATIIDPFNGKRDLAARIFRHVSSAFAEDPVRILRVARFAARFHEFTIAPETMQLMRSMVDVGEVDALVPERVWQETARGLMEHHPSRMLQVLDECGALARIFPELDWSQDGQRRIHRLKVIDFAAQENATLAVRWAALLTDCADSDCRKLCERVKVPVDVRDIAIIAAREHQHIEGIAVRPADIVVSLLERCDALRRPERFAEIIKAVRCYHLQPSTKFPQQAFLEQSLLAAQSIPGKLIAEETAKLFPKQPQKIASQIYAARVEALGKLPAFKKEPS